jgi:hypothetical protein
MLVCVVCGDAYLPWSRPRDETCPECFRLNFKDSQELRVDTPPPLTDRQRAALQGPAWYVTQAREAAHQRYEVACREALQQRLAPEDAHG